MAMIILSSKGSNHKRPGTDDPRSEQTAETGKETYTEAIRDAHIYFRIQTKGNTADRQSRADGKSSQRAEKKV